MLNQKRDFNFCESFIYNKKCYVPFLQVLSPTVVFFSVKAITENQLHNFLINSRDSYKKMLFTQLHIMRDYNHHRSSHKILASEGKLFHQKVVIFFPSFFFSNHEFFSLIELISFVDPLHQKIAET